MQSTQNYGLDLTAGHVIIGISSWWKILTQHFDKDFELKILTQHSLTSLFET
jgi:hypothetical protein